MSETVLLGKVKDPELIVLNFRGQLQCRMGENEKVLSRPTRSSGTCIQWSETRERSRGSLRGRRVLSS